MKIIYLNKKNKQIVFSGSAQDVLNEVNYEAIYINEISSEELRVLLEMVNENNIYDYRNFIELAVMTLFEKICT